MARSAVTVKTRGFRECEKVLSELPKATAKNVLRRVAKPPMERMADQAAAQAPEASGLLSFSVTVSEKPTRRAKWKRGVFRSERSSGIIIAMGPGSGVGALEYATFVEFGTVDTPPQPFMRPTWDSQAHRALDYVQDNLWLEVSKAAERFAGKQVRRAS